MSETSIPQENVNSVVLNGKSLDIKEPPPVNKEQQTPKDKVLDFFGKQSGFNQEEIKKRLGDEILQDLDLPLEGVLIKYFDDADDLSGIKTSIKNYYQYSPEDAIGYAWRDILALKLIGKGDDIDPKDEKILEAVSLSPLILLQKAAEIYSQGNWSYKGFLKERDLERINKTLRKGESLEDRINFTQEKLERIRKIGLETIKKGKIPVLRVLFLEDAERTSFLKTHENKTEFSPRNPNIKPFDFTLSDVISHTRHQEENTPFDSWTYDPPNCSSLYYANQLAEGKAMILVSEVSREEMLWAREFSAPYVTKEVWRFYRDFEITAPKIENANEQKLQNLKGTKGVFSPTESEAVLWENQPITAIMNFAV